MTDGQQDQNRDEKIELVIFTMAHRYFAFKGPSVREILPVTPISQVPGCPRILRGIINVRGVIESVLDLHLLLEFSEPPVSTRTRFILGQAGNLFSAIQVESVDDVICVDASRIKPLISTLPEPTRKFALGGGELYKNHYVVLLCVKKIFNELITLAEHGN